MHYFNNNFLIHDSKLKMIFFNYRRSSICTVSTSMISTNMIFQKVLHKIVQGEDLISKFLLA